MKDTKRTFCGGRRFSALLLSAALTVTAAPVSVWAGAQEPLSLSAGESGITLTVIGDTGDHSYDEEEHTGYVYWLKDAALDVSLDSLDSYYVAENCGDQIRAALDSAKITYDLSADTLYPYSLEKDGVELLNGYPGGWRVYVAYEDGGFSADGWGNYSGAATLEENCRLIMYWTDDPDKDCRLSKDGYNDRLNYDTDAVTGIRLYAEDDPDQSVSQVKAQVGQEVRLDVKYTVPAASKVSREVTCESANPAVAEAVDYTAEDDPQIGIIPRSAGETDVKVWLNNTLGERVEASVHVSVTADGTTITGMSFAEGSFLSMGPGETAKLTPVFTPELPAGETAPSPSWESSNPDAVSVDSSSGQIQALKPGTATIQAVITNNRGVKVSAQCEVTVKEIPATAISMSQTSLNLDAGESSDLTLRVTPANATVGEKIVWESDDPAVASVEGDGLSATVRARSGGMAVITARAGELTATCSVLVTGSVQETENLLDTLTFAADKDGKTVYGTVTEWDPEQREGTVAVPENKNAFYLKPELSAGTDSAEIQAVYMNYNDSRQLTQSLADGEFTAFSGTNRLFNAGVDGKDLTITVASGNREETYTVHVVRETVIQSLELTGEDGGKLYYEPETFSAETTEYSLRVPEDAEIIHIQMTGRSDDTTVFAVNGESAAGGVYQLSLAAGETTAVLTAGTEHSVKREYTLTVKRVGVSDLTVTTVPEDALFALYDSHDSRVWPADGVYHLMAGEEYSYAVTKSGYISKSGTLLLDGPEHRSFSLEKAPESIRENLDADWAGFRNSADNQAVTEAATPTDAGSVELKWQKQYGRGHSSGAVSSPILVDDKIYCYAGNKLMMLNKETGEQIKETEMAGSSSFSINPPTYADGMIFVGLNGKIQAFDAKTLESLWVYTDPLGGQPNSTIRYDSGYIYTGFWNSVKGGNLVCIPVDDEVPGSGDEVKQAAWRLFDEGGFYWAGSWTNEKYVIVGSDQSLLYCLDKNTGKAVQTIDVKELAGEDAAEIRSDISYYNGRIYFTSKGGYLFSYNLNEDGTIDTEHLIQPLKLGTMSTSTPLVYNDRIYVGVTHGGNFSGTYGISVVNINSADGALSLAYEMETDAYPQTSGVLSTAYEEETGYVYVYFLTNGVEGNLYLLKDKAGLTEAAPGSGLFYTPEQKEYCICSVVVDDEGTLYFKNDSAYLMAVAQTGQPAASGDINGDGFVDSWDAVDLLKAVNAGEADSLENGDYNGDGFVDNWDAVDLLKYVNSQAG